VIPEPSDLYLKLRRRALEVGRDDLAPGSRSTTPVIALLMETGFPEAVATLVGLADGTTSFYFSNGGGMIGGGEHTEIAAATRRWLEVGAEFLRRLEAGDEFPLPEEGMTQFVAVTDGGRLLGSASSEELGAGGHALSPLFYVGHGVITALRLLDEEKEGSS
jgi:hypothetical protein